MHIARLPFLAVFFLAFFPAPQQAVADTWAIYWYVCGSDLEAEHGAATNDIVEMARATFAPHVRVVMQTGGTKRWDAVGDEQSTLQISASNIERFLFADGSLERLVSLPQDSMGRPGTLEAFLRFCVEKYPADHRVLIIWDHGAGSSKEFANDQNFDMKGMTLPELRRALSAVFGGEPAAPPLDIIGFDACLMASIDTAVQVQGFAKYLVASEEVETGLGWFYTEPVSRLSADPGMDALTFARILCDASMQAAREQREAHFDPSRFATFSVIDVEEAATLKLLWDMVGMEALSAYASDDTVPSRLARQARRTEHFLNSRAEGFSNMMDMGAYLRTIRDAFPESVDLALEQLANTVLHNVTGEGHRNATGISCYYPFDGAQTFSAMLNERNLSSFVLLQGVQFGQLDGDAAAKHLETITARIEEAIRDESNGKPESDRTPEPVERPREQAGQGGGRQTFSHISALLGTSVAAVGGITPMNHDISSLEDWHVDISTQGDAVLNLGPERSRYLESVAFYLALVDREQDLLIMLGRDGDMYSDWDRGVFRSHFQNHWAQINDNLVALELTGSDEKTFYYTVPARLNGTRVNIYATYDLERSAYTITGARRILGDDFPDKFLTRLRPGDTVTTLFQVSTLSDASDFRELEIDTFTVGDRLVMEDTDLGDCQLAYVFEMNDAQGQSVLSDVTFITVKNGTISMEN